MHTPSDAIFFCHGAPGSTQDANLLLPSGPNTQVFAPDMFCAGPTDVSRHVIKAFDQTTGNIPDGRLHVVGFSIGAMVAIKVAAARPNRVGRLTLISPAAPLSLGDFLPDMAGRAIFDMALNRPRTLRFVTKAQAVLSRVLPNMLINQVFAKCGTLEKELLDDAGFRAIIQHGFHNSFREHPNAYIGLLHSYVGDWSAEIAQVFCPTEIWHGDKDTWSPISMAHALVQALPNGANLNVVQNGEHYSTLKQALLHDDFPSKRR